MLSVVTVTNKRGLDITFESLRKQTLQDFEWVIVDGNYDLNKSEVEEYSKHLKIKHLKEPEARNPQLTSVPFNLALCYNFAIPQCEGDYIVSLQDYIWIPANGLERLREMADDQTVVMGTGHKARWPMDWDFPRPFRDRPEGISEVDDRLVSHHEPYFGNYSEMELNYCIFPKKLFYDVGGMEEEFDNTWYGADNTALGLKAEIKGYKFLIDTHNECVGFNNSLSPRPKDWEERHNNKGNYNRWAETVLQTGEWKRYLPEWNSTSGR